MLETDIEAYLCERVEALGCYCLKQGTVAGIPDRIVITIDGRCLFCELKREDGKLNSAQVYVQNRLRKMHHTVVTLWSKEDVDNFVDSELLYK